MGGLLFLIKFNGACLRPPVPRPITGNRSMQVKFVDDSTQAASINLRRSLMQDPEARVKPLKYNERNLTIVKPEENILQSELDRFYDWTVQNKMLVNSKKCFVMKFSRSRMYDFPPEYTIGGSKILEEKNEMRILGILVQSNLGWNSQVNQMVGKASKTIWVIRRMKELGVDTNTLVNFWTSEGRVHLEMGCPVWHSSLTVAQSRALESGEVPESGYGSHSGALGTFTDPATRRLRAVQTVCQEGPDLPSLRPVYGSQIPAPRHLYCGKHQPWPAGQTHPALPGAQG
jgi:hypothetical protein